MFTEVHKSELRERLMAVLLPEVLRLPADELAAHGAPERGKEHFRRACIAERLTEAAIYLCENRYLDDRDGRDRPKDQQ